MTRAGSWRLNKQCLFNRHLSFAKSAKLRPSHPFMIHVNIYHLQALQLAGDVFAVSNEGMYSNTESSLERPAGPTALWR